MSLPPLHNGRFAIVKKTVGIHWVQFYGVRPIPAAAPLRGEKTSCMGGYLLTQ